VSASLFEWKGGIDAHEEESVEHLEFRAREVQLVEEPVGVEELVAGASARACVRVRASAGRLFLNKKRTHDGRQFPLRAPRTKGE
jgi:hypothetical protein